MPFGQRNVAKEDNIQLKTLTPGGKYSVSIYTEASTVQVYINSLVVGVVEQLFTLPYEYMYSTENSTYSL